MLTFRHHHFRKTFLSFVPHVPNKPKKEDQPTLFRVQKRFSITKTWLPKCSICTPPKKKQQGHFMFFSQQRYLSTSKKKDANSATLAVYLRVFWVVTSFQRWAKLPTLSWDMPHFLAVDMHHRWVWKAGRKFHRPPKFFLQLHFQEDYFGRLIS